MILRPVLAGLLLAGSTAFASANLVVNVGDGAGTGFNDPTPVLPVGGNTGTTLGAQRLAVLEEAARLWGLALDSDVTINILGNWQAMTCNATSGVLAQALSPSSTRAELPASPFLSRIPGTSPPRPNATPAMRFSPERGRPPPTTTSSPTSTPTSGARAAWAAWTGTTGSTATTARRSIS